MIKDDVSLELYLKLLPRNLWISMFKFRTDNHKFPVETGRWNDIEYRERKCTLCDSGDVGDNFHYLLICSYFKSQRNLYVDKKYFRRPNILKYKELLSSSDKITLEKLSKFVKILMNKFSNV